MTREEIEEAAGNYSGSILGFKHLSSVMSKHKAFFDGAYWRIDSVWHNSLKDAKPEKQVLVKFTNKIITTFDDVRYLNGIEDMVEEFAYIEDLLPTK